MRLKGIEFGRVLAASGVQGFFGEGYWFHPYLKPIGLDFRDVTFVAKTTTLKARLGPPDGGNMPLRADFTPRERFPKCIHVKFWKGVALNSVGLSGPGARALFETGRWQARTKPFFISFMSVAHTAEERISELLDFIDLFSIHLPRFQASVGLQINYSCPNVGLHLSELLNEIDEGLRIASRLGIPLMPKFNVTIPVEIARDIGNHHCCDAMCVSNTIPYGQLAPRIDWHKLFGRESPLQQFGFGGGGLSGKPLLPLLLAFILKIRDAGFMKPINAGGGILSLHDALRVMDRLDDRTDSISLGSIAFLRPWRVREIGRTLNGPV